MPILSDSRVERKVIHLDGGDFFADLLKGPGADVRRFPSCQAAVGPASVRRMGMPLAATSFLTPSIKT